MPRSAVILVVMCAMLLGMSPSIGSVPSSFDPDLTELIVKFERDGDDVLLPEDAIDVIEATMTSQKSSLTADDWALYSRLGSPVAGRWLVETRLGREYVDELLERDVEHPEVHLQEFILLRYADATSRAIAQEKLAADASVGSVVVNSRGGFSLQVNDYYATTPGATPGGYQWALESLAAMSPSSDPGQSSAWDKATGFGYVAIVDSGILPSHPDLEQNFKAHFSQAFYSNGCSGSQVDVDESGASSTCPNVNRGHGTHIAGIIAATPKNSIGVAGLCWDCSLIIAKAYSSGVPRVADRINGLIHAAMRGAQFVNFSGQDEGYLGQYGVGVTKCQDLPNGGAQDAYCSALALLALRQVMFVAASGNSNSAGQTDFPAREASSVSVAATKYTGQVWYGEPGGVGSSLGKVDFVAPGAEIVSTFYTGAIWSTTWPDPWQCRDDFSANSYDKCTGTSMATPHVVGVAAVVRSINPLLSVSGLKTLLTNSSANVAPPAGVNPPGGQFKQPNMLAAVNAAIGNGFTWPAFAMVTAGSSSNRFTTSIPQMARAAVAGTMLPTVIQPDPSVYYLPDPNAPVVAGYSSFPDSAVTPRAYFKVYTRFKTSQTNLKPLFRLSKLQNLGSGTDQCGTPMPVPSKPIPVIHFYTTSKSERAALTASTYGNCYKYDGVEGYVAPSNLGSLQQLYRLYNPTADSWILVPSSHVATANALGYTQNQSSLGWVVPN